MDKKNIKELVVSNLIEITGEKEIGTDCNIQLYEEGFLDSMSTIELAVALSEELMIDLDPSIFEREDMGTINGITDTLVGMI